ncbi:beta-ketoacyl-ACP synthase III [Desulfoscipio gibsoniae]|uniref:Beta-ketoacyl-[acyl-carrier-protein] synthase III n=1 Tax=Desulfoscipio gibsoniae DSM 7213 TaxID=767817 RepID=R4KT47_9FIRM|nr:beta-ketoacyl-ACP synthase III [Desulfoscipio gibsoniae]AGL02771.1 3-oxoacyl-(acyl-carrier-protein) synthase III [Desulfoscipio gibsoniae DSM 7213]
MPDKLINAGIAGIGVCVPDRVLTNADLEKMVATSDEWIVSRSGIRERHIVSPGEATSDLSTTAAVRAMANAGVTPEQVDLVIVATSTPDMPFPATACLVQDRIGAKNAGAFDLAAGCTGFIYALPVASQFIATGSYRTVLVIGSDIPSRFVNWEDRSTCVLFGDGAGAVVLKPVPEDSGILAFKLWSDGAAGPHLTLPGGGSRHPPTRETVDSKLHCIQMNGHEVFKLAVKAMGKVAQEVLVAAGLKKSELDFFIPHQANIKIIEAVAKRLDLPAEKVLINVDRYGNTSTASIPIALEEALRNGRIKKGDHILMVSFGAGMTWGGVAMKW